MMCSRCDLAVAVGRLDYAAQEVRRGRTRWSKRWCASPSSARGGAAYTETLRTLLKADLI